MNKKDLPDVLGRTLFNTTRADGSVDRSAAPGQHVCDFCLSPDPAWEYPCGEVELVSPSYDASDDNWLACHPCHELIEAGDMDALVRGTVERQRKVQDLRVLPYQKEREAYEMKARCVNCGWRGTLLIARGEEAPGRKTTIFGPGHGYCDQCGCRGLTTRLED